MTLIKMTNIEVTNKMLSTLFDFTFLLKYRNEYGNWNLPENMLPLSITHFNNVGIGNTLRWRTELGNWKNQCYITNLKAIALALD